MSYQQNYKLMVSDDNICCERIGKQWMYSSILIITKLGK